MAYFHYFPADGTTYLDINIGRETYLPILGKWEYLCERWSSEYQYEEFGDYETKWNEWLEADGYKGVSITAYENRLMCQFTKVTKIKGITGLVMLQFDLSGLTGICIQVLTKDGKKALGHLVTVTQMGRDYLERIKAMR